MLVAIRRLGDEVDDLAPPSGQYWLVSFDLIPLHGGTSPPYWQLTTGLSPASTMQKLDEQKRQKILQCAAELFATRPFHKVLLSDVAEVAEVGKGTVYTYFKNKDDLYLSVLFSGFERLVDQLRQRLEADEACSAEEALAIRYVFPVTG